MLKKSLVVTLVAALATCFPARAFADIVCPDSSYCTVTFGTSGKNVVTISPNGSGDRFIDAPSNLNITIRVYLKNCMGAPLAGVPAQEIVLYNNLLCICPGGNIADAPTDLHGMTTFTGTIAGGGCVPSLDVWADGVRICTLPIRINSWDAVPASPCSVDGSDLSAFAQVLGVVSAYNICFDYNESGPPTIDGADLSSLAVRLRDKCQ